MSIDYPPPADTCRAAIVEMTSRAFEVGHVSIPVPGKGEVLIEVHAAGVNRADIDQRQGAYPPPKGASSIIGLEVSGRIKSLGESVTDFQVNDRVMSLVTGGGYSEYVVAPAATTFKIPNQLTYAEAAALPEALFTVWSNVFMEGQLKPGETLLVHGGASAIGSATIQIAKAMGATVITTAGSDEKCAACKEWGADLVIPYRRDDFKSKILEFTNGQGVDVIFDWVGSSYLSQHLDLLKRKGRLVYIDSRTGDLAQIDLGTIMTKNLVITGSLLRPRPLEEKAKIAQGIKATLLPKLEAGVWKPKISHRYPLSQSNLAHEAVEQGLYIGKVIILVREEE